MEFCALSFVEPVDVQFWQKRSSFFFFFIRLVMCRMYIHVYVHCVRNFINVIESTVNIKLIMNVLRLALPRWYQELLLLPIVYGMLEVKTINLYCFWDDIPVSCNLFIVVTRKMTLFCCNTWYFWKRFAPLFFFINIHFILLTFEKYSELWMHCKNCLLLWKTQNNALWTFLFISATVVP